MDIAQTARLVLRRYQDSDREKLIKLFTDEEVMKHVDDGVASTERAETIWSLVLKNDFEKREVWAVFSLNSGDYFGPAKINRRAQHPKDWELGFIVRKEAWARGYATEIASFLVRFAFERLKLNEVFATVDDDHFASINVLKKVGMNFLRYEFDNQGRFSVYSIDRSNYRASIKF